MQVLVSRIGNRYSREVQMKARDQMDPWEGRAEEATRREQIFRRDDFRCVYCGEVFDPRFLTLDHVEPRMRGGDHSEGNLVTACEGCNTAKGAEPAWSYLADKSVQRANFFEYAEHVWPRLRRAIEEAADRPVRRRRTR